MFLEFLRRIAQRKPQTYFNFSPGTSMGVWAR